MKFEIIVPAMSVGSSALSVQANELPNGPHIITSGVASADVTPSIATPAIKVNVAAKDVASAKKQADERVAQYLPLLKQSQIVKKDISAANSHTQPDYDHQNGKSILRGYHAVYTIEVTLCQLDKLNALPDDALRAGLSEICPVLFGVTQPDTYKNRACRAAIDDAVHWAEQLAAGFNNKLGPVYSVRHHVPNYQPSPTVWMMKANATPVISAQETYEQPVIQLNNQVDVVFQIEPTAGQPTTTSARTQ